MSTPVARLRFMSSHNITALEPHGARRFYAGDGLRPSSDGYRDAYSTCAATPLVRVLTS